MPPWRTVQAAAKNAVAVAKEVADAVEGADAAAVENAINEKNDAIQADSTKPPAQKGAAQAIAAAVEAAAPTGAKVAALEAAANAAVAEAVPGKAVLNLPTATTPLILEAANEGSWGNKLRARVDYEGLDQVGDRFEPLESADLFNLTVRDTGTGTTERFLNLALKESARRVDRVLENESNLVRIKGALPSSRPLKTGLDDVGVAEADKASDGGC